MATECGVECDESVGGGLAGDVPQQWPAAWRAAGAASEHGLRAEAPKRGREDGQEQHGTPAPGRFWNTS